MKALLTILTIGLAVFTHSATAESINISERMNCLRASMPTTVGVRNITLTTTDRAGTTKSLTGRLYAMQEEVETGKKLLRATLRIDEPPNLAGSAYLVRETDDFLRDGMFVYLPAVGRVRRISGDVADRSLMGTGFSYFDFKQLANAFGDLNPELLAIETVGARKTEIYSFKPLEGIQTRYTSIQGWMDVKSCLLIRADFLQGEKIVKRLVAPPGSVKKTGSRWSLNELEITDAVSGTKTEMLFEEVTIDEKLSAQRFSPKSFYLTR